MCTFVRSGSVTFGVVGGAPRALPGDDVAGFLVKFPGAVDVSVETWDDEWDVECDSCER